MIVIEKNTSKNCTFTLNENQTITDHDWLFEFTHEMTGEVKLFTGTDISQYPQYNEFIITDSTTENAYNSTMDFRIGTHKYVVYEMAVESPVNLNPLDSLAIVEDGMATVLDPNAATDNYFNEDESKNSGEFNEE